MGVFFTLSGYLITDILLAQIAGRGLRLGRFWLGRARRLLPALLSMLAIVSAWVAIAGPAQHEFGEVVAAAVLYVSNWQLIFQHVSYFARFGPPTPLNHLWSLGIEEQFYIFWPLLLILGVRLMPERSHVGGTRPLLASLTVLLAAASAIEMAVLCELPTARGIYFGTDTRATFERSAEPRSRWCGRAASAGGHPAGARHACDGLGVIGLVGIGVLIWTTNQYSAFRHQGEFVLLTIDKYRDRGGDSPCRQVRSRARILPLRWIGVRSYGISGTDHRPDDARRRPQRRPLALHTLQVVATILVAALSWRYLEQPDPPRARAGRSRGGATAIGLSAVCTATGSVLPRSSSSAQSPPWSRSSPS